ncbi:hypothetical protein B0J13DRAFT_533172 [Dactylonectria estremocensis]|uniref:Uncharacterized protein n=1 Tax=Dactylonectria estremocensis TaxID=1079267 RepID=A0A9P9DCK7_9HYPO|nr:hypothetical protein B0J13DRAFT_533172 [Dactylonectria estremocensis]
MDFVTLTGRRGRTRGQPVVAGATHIRRPLISARFIRVTAVPSTARSYLGMTQLQHYSKRRGMSCSRCASFELPPSRFDRTCKSMELERDLVPPNQVSSWGSEFLITIGANMDDASDDEAKYKANCCIKQMEMIIYPQKSDIPICDTSKSHESHANSGNTRDGDIDNDEVGEDEAEDGNSSSRPTSNEDTNAGNDINASDDASVVRNSSDYKARGRHNAINAIARDDTPIEDVLDSNVHDEPDSSNAVYGVASTDAITVDEAINSNRRDGIDAAVAAANSDEGIAI